MTNIHANVITIAIIVLIMCLGYVIYRFIYLVKELNKKNITLTQNYLNSQFIRKSLINNLQTPNSATFCTKLIAEIKEYYNLEDLIVVDTMQSMHMHNNNVFRSKILNYVQQNINQIIHALDNFQLKKYNINGEYEIYLAKKMRTEHQDEGLIICIENTPTLLTKQEKAGLETMLTLLQSRLVQSQLRCE